MFKIFMYNIMNIFDIVLINIISYMTGIFTGIGIYIKYKKNIIELNHDNPRIITTTYPPLQDISSSLNPHDQASAPTIYNLQSEQSVITSQTIQQPQTEIIIKSKTTE